jgi:oligopeptide/dipeptide ABC transporter ATP-binding protein
MNSFATADPEPILEVKDLVKHFVSSGSWSWQQRRKTRAVDGISFKLLPGSTLALVGESGCGKSTTAKLILQLLEPDSGDIRLCGESVTKPKKNALRRLRRNVQMVFQDPYASLTPHLKIGAVLREPFLVKGVRPRYEINERVRSVLTAVGLDPDIAQRFPHELSGGQRQRVGIARAIAGEPRLIVCDEPVSALDVSIRSQIINLLLDLQKSRGLSFLFISHDLDLVAHVSDVVAVMYLGKIVEQAPAATFFAQPRHPYSQALLASSPIPDPRRRTKPAIRGEIMAGTELGAGCRFRNRCPLAVSLCAAAEPELQTITESHEVACHRADETAYTHEASQFQTHANK